MTRSCWDIPLLYLRSFSIWGHFNLKHFYSLVWLFELKFQIWGRSDQWLLRYLRSYSIWGFLHLNNFYWLVCSSKLKFKIWGRSDHWFLRYFIFDIWVHLPLEVFFILINLKIWEHFDQWLLRYSAFRFEVLFNLRSFSFKTFL